MAAGDGGAGDGRAAAAEAVVRDLAAMLPRGLPRGWRDAVTGVERHGPDLALADLLADFPVALLLSEPVP